MIAEHRLMLRDRYDWERYFIYYFLLITTLLRFSINVVLTLSIIIIGSENDLSLSEPMLVEYYLVSWEQTSVIIESQNVNIRWRQCIWMCTSFWKLEGKPSLNRSLTAHYDDVIMSTIASQITSLTSVYSTIYSDADQSKHQSCASLAFVWGIHRGPVNSPHKWPVTRKMFPFDDVIMT